MEDDKDESDYLETLKRIDFCLKCNRRNKEETFFCMETENPISEMTSNLNINCPLGKF